MSYYVNNSVNRGVLVLLAKLAQKELCDLLNGICGRCDRVADCALMAENLEVISAFESFVAKEVNLIIVWMLQCE